MLFAQALDDLGARSVAVADDAGEFRLGNELREEILREAGGLFLEIAPIEGDRAAGHFPMAARRVLAAGDFARGAVDAGDGIGRNAGQHAAMHQMRRKTQPEPCQVRNLQRLALRGAALGDVTQGVGAFVAEAHRVRCRTEAEGIHHQDDRALGHGGEFRARPGPAATIDRGKANARSR